MKMNSYVSLIMFILLLTASSVSAAPTLGVAVPLRPPRLLLLGETRGTDALHLRMAQAEATAPVGSAPSEGGAPVEAAPAVRTPAEAALAVGSPQEPSLADLEANALYRLAVIQVAEGKMDLAKTFFEKVVKHYPGTAAAGQASLRLLELQALPTVTAPVTVNSDQGAGGSPSQSKAQRPNSGRAEFIVSESLLGGWTGAMLNVLMDIQGVESVLLPIMGLGAGLGTSIFYSEHYPVSSAQAAQLRAAQVISMISTTGWVNAWGGLNRINTGLSQVLGFGLGTALGMVSLKHLPLTEGQVSVVAAAGLWSPVLVELVAASIFAQDLPSSVYQTLFPAALDAGVVGALLLAKFGDLKLSRGRMLLINLGGGLGFALSGALMLTVVDSPDLRSVAGVLVLGSLAGLGSGIWATQNWDATYNPEVLARSESPSVLTVEDGRLKLGRFSPMLMQEHRVSRVEGVVQRETGTRISLGLLGGTF